MKSITYLLAIVLLLPACKKTGNGSGGSGGTTGGGDIMYPATLSFYQGNNSAYPSNSTFKYDDKHHLTYYGNNESHTNVAGNSTQLVVLDNSDTLIDSYLYSGDILTGKGVDQVKTNYMWKYSNGSSYTGPVNTYYFANTDATGNFLGSYNGGTYTQFFTYDNNGSLTYSKIVTNSSGSPNSSDYNPGGLEYDHITFKNYDDKPSPYSAIAGWRYISYQWAYPWQFYLSLSQHNPGQIVEESLNTDTMKWFVYSQSDLTYTYGDNGYPSQIKITTTYPNSGTPNQTFLQTYNFTYSK